MSEIQNNLNYEILPDDYTQYDLSFKCIVIGDSGVGKSSLTNKATNNIFDDNYKATVGFEFFTFNIKINDTIIKLQVWDTCGQELYRSLITNFYRNSSLALIVYSVTSERSFTNIDTWLQELRTHSNPDVKMILIGNKIDLIEQRVISKEQGELLAKKNNMNLFIETSAKAGINAQNTFVQMAYILYQDYLKYKNNDDLSSDSTYKTVETTGKTIENKKQVKSGCC